MKMKSHEFKRLIREEIRRVIREESDPIQKVYSRLQSIADRSGSESRFLDALGEYLMSVGVYDIFDKWLDASVNGTSASLSTSESNKLIKALTEFLEGSKSPAANSKRIYKLVTQINRAMPGYDKRDYSEESSNRLYKFIDKQLSPKSLKLFQSVRKMDRDLAFGSKSQIDALIRELEQISARQGRM